MSGVFTATIFIPDIIIPANLFPGVFTAAGITEWSRILLLVPIIFVKDK